MAIQFYSEISWIVCSSSANLTEFLQLVIDGRLISFLSIPSNIRYLIPGHFFDDDHEMKCFFDAVDTYQNMNPVNRL